MVSRERQLLMHRPGELCLKTFQRVYYNNRIKNNNRWRIQQACKIFYTGYDVIIIFITQRASSQEGYKPQMDQQMNREILHSIVSCKNYVLPEVANFISPSALSAASFTECTALRP